MGGRERARPGRGPSSIPGLRRPGPARNGPDPRGNTRAFPHGGGAGRARPGPRHRPGGAGRSWAPLPPGSGPGSAAVAEGGGGQHAEPAGARRGPGPLLHGDGAAAAPPRAHRLQGHGAGESAPGRAPASASSLPVARAAAGRPLACSGPRAPACPLFGL